MEEGTLKFHTNILSCDRLKIQSFQNTTLINRQYILMRDLQDLFCKHPNLVLKCYSTLAPAYFNDDDTLDFMLHMNKGSWPKYLYSQVRKRGLMYSCWNGQFSQPTMVLEYQTQSYKGNGAYSCSISD